MAVVAPYTTNDNSPLAHTAAERRHGVLEFVRRKAGGIGTDSGVTVTPGTREGLPTGTNAATMRGMSQALRSTAAQAEPLVAVIIPALNEAGKIGRVLDKLPHDGRFEAIVVDDGIDRRDRRRGARARCRGRHPPRQRGGVGAAIRDGWKEGLRRERPYLALLSGDDQHEPSELITALDRRSSRRADYVQGSRWTPGRPGRRSRSAIAAWAPASTRSSSPSSSSGG